MGRRGQVLVHVLITTVIVSVIAAGLAQMLMLRYAANARATTGASNRAWTQAALNQAVAAWNTSGNNTCGAIAGFTHTSGTVGSCNCVYTNASPPAGLPEVRIVATGPAGTPCTAQANVVACTQNDDGTTWPAGCP